MKRIVPDDYPPAIAELLQQLPLAPLGPGKPHQELRAALAAATEALADAANRDMAAACQAGLWLAFDFLDESHRISQDLDTAEGSYWHALMHRREPDHDNAAYWLRRVPTHPIHEPLRQAAARLATNAPADAAFLAKQARWDAFAFNDLCAASASPEAPAHALCPQVQRAEWELLFDWCFRHAMGRAKS